MYGGKIIQYWYLFAVTEPALHDTLAGEAAGELSRRASGGGAARRLVRTVQTVRRTVAVPSQRYTLGAIGAGKCVRTTVTYRRRRGKRHIIFRIQ